MSARSTTDSTGTVAAHESTAWPAELANRLPRLEWLGALGGIVLLSVILTVASPYFLTANNLTTILVQSAATGVLAVGETFVILTAEIDLSVAAVAALCGSVTGQLAVHSGMNQYLAIVVGLALGAGVGLLNGTLVALVGIPSFIVTLGGLSLWQGLAYQATNGLDTSPMPSALALIGRGTIAGMPAPIAILLMITAGSYLVLRFTKLGRYAYAIGSDAGASLLVGIPVRRYKAAMFIMSGTLAALAAMVLIGRQDSSGGNIALNLELDAIAAVILGGTSLFGGRGNVIGSVIGAVLMTTIRNGLSLLQVSQFMQQVVLGAVIIIAIAIEVLGRKATARGR